MVPAIIAPTVVARFGPWLGRVVRSRPGLIDTLVAKLRAGGAVVSTGVSGVVNYFKSSPASAALTLATLASLGIAVNDLYNSEEVDEELQGLLTGLDDVSRAFTPEQVAKSAARILKVGAKSEDLKFGLAEREVDTLSAIDILSWAKAHYGSEKQALRGHRMAQAFQEMSYEDVRTGFATLKLN